MKNNKSGYWFVDILFYSKFKKKNIYIRGTSQNNNHLRPIISNVDLWSNMVNARLQKWHNQQGKLNK
jgi:hypothetical protein